MENFKTSSVVARRNIVVYIVVFIVVVFIIVCMFIEAKLIRYKYNITRIKDKERFLWHKKIQKAKTNCYPKKEYISITDSIDEKPVVKSYNFTSRASIK